jgi:hypothetical protein
MTPIAFKFLTISILSTSNNFACMDLNIAKLEKWIQWNKSLGGTKEKLYTRIYLISIANRTLHQFQLDEMC